MISGIIGGLGLFLLGMLLLTENLKAAASDSVHALLNRFTNRPLTGVLTGAGITAILQSSSATTLITIGLVSSGLLSFPRSLSIIYGANLGTTSTAWIVSLVGLKLSMTALALPLLGFGAFLRLFSTGVWRYVGLVIAGFAMIFLGIDFLQSSMSDLSEKIDLTEFVADGVMGLVIMVVLGMIMTVVMQSSSAAVVVTLTLLHSGALTLDQAAAAVIGQNVGTTMTAALGAIGSSIQAKRTALAHVLFNLVTALVALAFLPVLITLIDSASDRMFGDVNTISLSLFQTSFNLLGVLIFLPATNRFAAWIEKILPETRSGDGFAPVHVKDGLTGQRATLDAASVAVRRIMLEAVHLASAFLTDNKEPKGTQKLLALRTSLGETYRFLRATSTDPAKINLYKSRLSLLHAMDHADQMTGLLLEGMSKQVSGKASEDAFYRETVACLQQVSEALDAGDSSRHATDKLQEKYDSLSTLRQLQRMNLLEDLAQNRREPVDVAFELDGTRRADQLAYHAWRAAHYLISGVLTTDEEFPVPIEEETVEPETS